MVSARSTTRADTREPSDQDRAFWAFISYSHADEKAAANLHRYLERFSLPRQLVGRETQHGQIPRKLRPVFRDREEFPASSDLGRAIRDALGASRNLIVVCSPSAAASEWVEEEIRHFKVLGREDRAFCYLVAGDPELGGSSGAVNGAFAPALLLRFNAEGRALPGAVSEPLAVDPAIEGKSSARVKLVAGLLGVDYDDLRQRVRRQAIRRAVSAGVLLVAVAVSFTTVWFRGRQDNQLAEAQQLAATARQVYTDQPLLGLRLALEAAATAPSHNAAALRAIVETGKALARRGRIAKLGSEVEQVFVDSESRRFVVDFSERPGELRSGTDGSLVATLRRPVYRSDFLSEVDEQYFLVDYRGNSELRRSDDGSVVAELVATARVRFSPDPGRRFFFTTNSGGYPNELRHLEDGSLVPLQPNSRPASVTFSRDLQWRWFVVKYYSDEPMELRRTDDSAVVELPAVPEQIRFSPDPRARRMLIRYEDGGYELRRTEDLFLIRRLPPKTQHAKFSKTGTVVHVKSSTGAYTLRSVDGKAGPPREVYSDDPAQSYRVEFGEDAARWWREADGQLLATQPGAYLAARFSRVSPAKYIALKRASGGYEIRSVKDGSLLHELEGALSVQLDAEHMLVRFEDHAELWRLADSAPLTELPRTRARGSPAVFDAEYVVIALGDGSREVRRLADGALVASLPGDVAEFRFPAPGLLEVKRADGSIEIHHLNDQEAEIVRLRDAGALFYPDPGLVSIRSAEGSLQARRLPRGGVVKLPGTRRVAGAQFLQPDARYTLVSYVDRTANLIHTVDGELVASLKGPGSFAGLTFLPETNPTHFLVDYDGRAAEVANSQLRRLSDGKVLATFNGRPTRVTLVSATASPMLIARYADGRAELWRGPDDPQLLDTLEPNLADFRLLEQSDLLVLRHSDGRAYILDLGWLVAANRNDLSDTALFELACRGPMARLLPPTDLGPFLRGSVLKACR